MITQVTFQGKTLEELTNELENWGKKEYQAVKEDYEFKINSIKTNPLYNA